VKQCWRRAPFARLSDPELLAAVVALKIDGGGSRSDIPRLLELGKASQLVKSSCGTGLFTH
jgi:hypothetical protein